MPVTGWSEGDAEGSGAGCGLTSWPAGVLRRAWASGVRLGLTICVAGVIQIPGFFRLDQAGAINISRDL